MSNAYVEMMKLNRRVVRKDFYRDLFRPLSKGKSVSVRHLGDPADPNDTFGLMSSAMADLLIRSVQLIGGIPYYHFQPEYSGHLLEDRGHE